MFYEFKTRKGDPILIPYQRIAYVTSYRGYALLYDVDGNEFLCELKYEEFILNLIENYTKLVQKI